MTREQIKDRFRGFAEERAENFVESYLPAWAIDDWTDEDTNFLRVYLLDCIADAVESAERGNDDHAMEKSN